MKIRLFYIWLLVVVCMGENSFAQTIYGNNGMIKIPDAYTTESGKAIFGGGFHNDYSSHDPTDNLYNQWHILFNVGLTSRLDLSLRLLGSPNLEVADSTIRFKRANDRILNVKLVLLKETDRLPQLSIGVQDLIGTRLFNSTYFVSSKTVKIAPKIHMHATMGVGTKLSNEFVGDAVEHRFIGLFSGLRTEYDEKLSFSVEYDARDVNLGLYYLYRKHWFLKTFVMDFREIGAALTVRFTL